MAIKEKDIPSHSSRMELMAVTARSEAMGIKFHIYLRKKMPSTKEFPIVKNNQWEKVQKKLESSLEWLPENRFEWEELDHVGRPFIHYAIHLKGGVTCFRSDSIQKIQVIFDHESDQKIVEKVTRLVISKKDNLKNQFGLMQMSYGTLNVKFVEFQPYEHDISPYLGDDIVSLKQEMLQSFNKKKSTGLYLIHGEPGTGKTSFLKEILNQTDRQALFIPPSIAGELSNPNLISLLMDHADSILIIEDAETILMKREADSSNGVSNLLNLTDGFPADILNLNVICTFNTKIEDIDAALLRKGRLKAKQEFKALAIEDGRKLAEKVGSEIIVDREMTVAEICNENSRFAAMNGQRGIGFNKN
jgi:hypothetical protein